MTAHTSVCKSCNAKIHGEIFHLGFSEMQALYCSDCPRVLLLKDQGILERAAISWPNLHAGDTGWQPWDQHLLSTYREIEQLFLPCSCGGAYRFMSSPRCPKCNDLLQGDLYEDKPIFKERDMYVFVTSGSIDDDQALKSKNRENEE